MYQLSLIYGIPRFEQWISSSLNATLDALNSAPRITFKLCHHFEFLGVPSGAVCLDISSLLEWEDLERAVATHPCRTNRVTFICDVGPEILGFKFEDVESFIRKKLPDLYSNGLLDFVRCVTE